jgi:hypothetical protein
MNNFKTAVAFIRTFLDDIKDLIALLDEAVPDGTPGQKKLDTFKEVVNGLIAAEQRFAPAAEMIWTLLVPLVSFIVAARKTQAAKAG